jgi:hypothetical protein
MTEYIPLRQYTAGQDPEAEEADDRLPLPAPRRRRRPKSIRNPGVIAGGVAVIFTLFLILSYSTTGDEQRIRDDGLGSGKGLMEVELPAPGKTIRARHPIAQLIEQAEGMASEMRDLRGSIRTLEDAVANYKETFGLDPPEGFDRWSVLNSSSFKDALSDPSHQRPLCPTLSGSNSQPPYHPPLSPLSFPKRTSRCSRTSPFQRICSVPELWRCSKTRASSG